MIEQQKIDGKPATVAYLTDEMTPCDNKDDAKIIRVLFEDGRSLWLTPHEPEAKADAVKKKKIAAGILFVTEGGKVLMGLRAEEGTYQGHWGIFGGHQEDGETLELTAIREVLEETGYEAKGSLQSIAMTTTGGTEFTYFVNVVEKPFEPLLNDEHTGFAWVGFGELPPGPVIPGLQDVLEQEDVRELRLKKMHETDIAKAMTTGALSSPQKYATMSMYRMRVTGTGTAFRRGDGKKITDEHVYRRPENYLSQDFLDRCQGLPVIFQHPEDRVLNSNEFKTRMVGILVCPYIVDDEVWGIAKIYDDEAITILDNEKMSTSPSVVFQDRTVNSTIALSDGSVLLIEGRPSLLDHLAICEAGVWDKGQEPSGIESEIV